MFKKQLLDLAFARDAKTAVLIHGCNIAPQFFDQSVIGEPGRPGIIPRAIEVAIALQANHIIWGNGSGYQEDMNTSRLMHEKAWANMEMILEHINGGLELTGPEYLYNYLDKYSVVDAVSKSCRDEIDFAAKTALRRNCNVVFQIQMPNYIARCYQEALKWSEQHSEASVLFIPIASAGLA